MIFEKHQVLDGSGGFPRFKMNLKPARLAAFSLPSVKCRTGKKLESVGRDFLFLPVVQRMNSVCC